MLKPTAELVAPSCASDAVEPDLTERFDQQSLHQLRKRRNNFPFKVNGPTINRRGSGQTAVELRDRADRTTIARVLIFYCFPLKKLFLNRHGQSFCTLVLSTSLTANTAQFSPKR